MSRFDAQQVHKLAELANLSLTEEESASFSRQLEQILEYAERIQALDTEGVAPTSHALLASGLGESPSLREDEPRPCLSQDRALANAPDGGEGLFKVPKVLP